jgi:thiol-disulfide isomerase/thioredoxin
LARTLFPRLSALLVVAVLATGCIGGSEATCERLPSVRPGLCIIEPGERGVAPVAELPLVSDTEETAGIAGYQDKVVVMNFWASWCGPCRAEQPVLNDAHERLGGVDVAFLGVNIGQDPPANALAHQREFDIPYPSLADPSNAYAAQFGGIGPRSIPSTILLDRQGRVAVRIFGEIFDPMELVVLVSRLVEE